MHSYRLQLTGWLTSRYTVQELRTIGGLKHLRVVIPDTRDWGYADVLRFAVRQAHQRDVIDLGLSEVGSDKQYNPEVRWRLDGQPAQVLNDFVPFVVDLWPRADASKLEADDLAFAVDFDRRLDVLAPLLIDPGGLGYIDPVLFPDVFGDPPAPPVAG